ncbi:MAG: phosphoglycerate mutase family protein [Candidatus Shapirobacteria bacterium]|nr:phosphoglycerate mutase family protein [Candidatus Shapirobacteria bacterium]
MQIILFRHGEKQRPNLSIFSDIKDVYLTKTGIVQIEKLGQALRKKFPSLIASDIIYSSHYTRAVQSADIVKSILNIKNSQIIAEFGEFMAYTNYQNPYEIRQHIQEMAMQDPDWVSPETNTSLTNILSSFQQKIIEIYHQSKPDIVLIASHGGIIRNFVYSLDPKFRPSDKLIAESKIHEGGYTVLDFDGQKFTIDQFDVHDYL